LEEVLVVDLGVDSGLVTGAGGGLSGCSRCPLTRGETMQPVELLSRELGRGVPIVLVLGQHVPDQHDEFSCDGGDGDVVGLTSPQAEKESVERSRDSHELMSGLDTDRTSMRAAAP
jgi:hypothetical protein